MARNSEQGKDTDLLQSFYDGLVSVMDNVRHELVEKPWFGWSNGQATTGDTPPFRGGQSQGSPEKNDAPSLDHWAKYQSEHGHSHAPAQEVQPATQGGNEPSWWQHEHAGSHSDKGEAGEQQAYSGWATHQDSWSTSHGHEHDQTQSHEIER